VVTPTGVSVCGAGYPPTIPGERDTEPDHSDPEDEMQDVVGSDKPVHEQHQVLLNSDCRLIIWVNSDSRLII
jgi:hypothetical protein